MYMGKLIEFGDTDTLFTNPAKSRPRITSPVATVNAGQSPLPLGEG